MSTTLPRTGLPIGLVDGDEYGAAALNTVDGYIETQLIGVLLALSSGVSAQYGPTAFAVTSGGSLQVTIAAGSGIALSTTLGAVAMEKSTSTTLTGLDDNVTRYLFATIEDSESNVTLQTGLPLFILNDTDTLDGGLLLAKVVTASGVVTLTDSRIIATPPRLRGVWDSAVQYRYNDWATTTGAVWRAKRDNLNVTPVAGADWEQVLGISGTVVTSVALSLPAIFSVSGSPVTTTGTLTATLANQTANTVFAGPASGSAAAPAFRQLVTDDIASFAATVRSTINDRMGAPVADNAALYAVTSSDYQDKQIRYVESSGVTNGSFYHFDSGSSATDDGDAVIQPTDITMGAGRWLRMGSGSGDADTLEGQTGSYYLDRANHTGEQAISTVTDLQDTLDAKLAIASNLSDVGNAATARTSLGLGTIATQAASSVTITGGSITGITDLAVADGGTGSSTASGARTNLGLGTAAVVDVPASGDATSGQAVKGNDSRLTDSRAPSGSAGGGLSGSYPNPSLASGIDAAKIADGSVSNTEFQYINSLTSNAQTQLTTALKDSLGYMLSDQFSDLVASAAVLVAFVPFACTVVDVFTAVTTQSSSGAVTTNIKKNGTTIFTTKPSIDATEDTSLTGTVAVLDGTITLAKGDKLTFDVDADGTGARGLQCYLNVTRT